MRIVQRSFPHTLDTSFSHGPTNAAHRRMSVHPAARGQGIGKKLLVHLEDYARQIGSFSSLSLLLLCTHSVLILSRIEACLFVDLQWSS